MPEPRRVRLPRRPLAASIAGDSAVVLLEILDRYGARHAHERGWPPAAIAELVELQAQVSAAVDDYRQLKAGCVGETAQPAESADLGRSAHDDWITPTEAARLRGVTPSAVRKRCRAGELGRRVGDRWLIDPAALELHPVGRVDAG